MINLNLISFSFLPTLAARRRQLEICPQAKTDIIGNRLAKTELVDNRIAAGNSRSRPRPKAVTKGTVTVDVVTPPES